MKILVTGARGMLGSDLCPVIEAQGDEVIRVSRNDRRGFVQFDLEDFEFVIETFERITPDAVIHCAAWTDVDGCTRNPDEARDQNAFATKALSKVCAQFKIPLLYLSTDFVFDGDKSTPYHVDDYVEPLNHYGVSKLEGEEYVQKYCTKHFIVRTSWLFGVHGKCFPATMLKLAEKKDSISVVADQIGSPTHTLDLAKSLAWLIHRTEYGTYHISNSGSCSWYEFACKTFEIAGNTAVKVLPIPASENPSPTKRPAYSVLDNSKIEKLGFPLLQSWEEALVGYFLI